MSQQHLTVVVHRLNEDLLLADSQVIEAVLSLAVPVLAPHVGPGGKLTAKQADVWQYPSLQLIRHPLQQLLFSRMNG